MHNLLTLICHVFYFRKKVKHDHQANLQNLMVVKTVHHKSDHDHQVRIIKVMAEKTTNHHKKNQHHQIKRNLLVVEKVTHQIDQLLVHQVNHEITRKIKMLKLNNQSNVDDQKVVKNKMKVNKNKDPNLQKRNQQEVLKRYL